MKRQSFRTKSGFTLFELMFVITIFWVFIYATSAFNYTPQTESERADRMMISVWAIVKTALQNVSIGKMPNRDGNISAVIKMTVGTGGITTAYFTWASATNPIKTETFSIPYFDRDPKYSIMSVTWTGSSTTTIGVIGTGQIIIDSDTISFSGAGITGSGYTLVEIKTGYSIRSRKVILDRRTGKLTETKLY